MPFCPYGSTQRTAIRRTHKSNYAAGSWQIQKIGLEKFEKSLCRLWRDSGWFRELIRRENVPVDRGEVRRLSLRIIQPYVKKMFEEREHRDALLDTNRRGKLTPYSIGEKFG